MRLLIIVSRSRPARYEYLRHVFAGPALEVILDRRYGERRQHPQSALPQRRLGDRRSRDLGADLWKQGWALVR